MRNWLLPEYIEDILPAEAARMETLRRQLLDLFRVHGYQYVIPPMLEYTESLLTGTAHHLDLATFKVVDQLTGRLMGVRADTTPQAARIDAHMLNHQGISRLCYAGTVLRTNPYGLARTREPMQLGAELFGHAGVESDIEIQRLMIAALKAIGIAELHVDLSHVDIVESLLASAELSADVTQELYAALQRKDQAQIKALTADLNAETQNALLTLTQLHGSSEILAEAQKVLPSSPAIDQALDKLRTIAQTLADMDVSVGIDLSELRGYQYHSGLVFAAYAQGYTGPIAMGGRYDDVGEAFGRARPATGFSLDLRGAVLALAPAQMPLGILAPIGDDADLLAKVSELRAAGEMVVHALPGTEPNMQELNCDRILEKQAGAWQVVQP